MTLPYDYNKQVLEKMMGMPDITITALIYHFILAKLIQCENNKLHLCKKIKVPIRTIRNKISEMRQLEYPVPPALNGVQQWTEKEKQDYENWIGFDCPK
jgi:hypothetical protein